jgi:hypothetical protein
MKRSPYIEKKCNRRDAEIAEADAEKFESNFTTDYTDDTDKYKMDLILIRAHPCNP